VIEYRYTLLSTAEIQLKGHGIVVADLEGDDLGD
jgi:hypothetical protein